MDVTIVQVDVKEDKTLLTHVCKLLFVEWGENYKYRYSLKDVPALIDFYEKHPEINLYVALDAKGSVRGCYSMIKKGNLYWLADMYVVPEYRNKGIGKMLVSHAINNKQVVALYTTDETISYYESLGFQRGYKYTSKDTRGRPFEFYSMLYQAKSDGTIEAMIVCVLAFIGLILLIILWYM